MSISLPIDEVLPAIRDALAQSTRLVLAAPPGAGKTTRAPLALLGADWLGGRRMLLLEPRRIAARMAAERMAATLDEALGDTIGLSTRVDRRVSAKTRIEVVTDGLFVRRLLDDGELTGVGAVFFDEFHERSINHDLGLALALDAQSVLRPDLRLVVMSATLDVTRVAGVIGAPVVESAGRAHPVETIYLGRGEEPLPDRMASAVRRALREQSGSILAFLPGVGEIHRTIERLGDLGPDVEIAPLFGALSPAEQDAAIAPSADGGRKVVVATDIAESSLTIEGVAVVVDAGLARVASFDPKIGSTRLETRRASLANVDQRRGRAGRMGPGVCYRLWDEEETRGLPREPTPEILAGDLSGLLLALASWGERDPGRLVWIDPPTDGRLAAARAALTALGALDTDGGLTPRGRAIAALPMEPRQAAMIAGADAPADRALAAEIAALLSEKGLGGTGADLRERIDRLRRDGSARARALKDQARRWAGAAEPAASKEAGRIVAAALPMRIAKARPGEGRRYLTAGGEAAHLDPADAGIATEWLAVAEAVGAAASARITAAAPLTAHQALSIGAVETVEVAAFDFASRSLKGRRVKRMGAIVLEETPLAAPSGDAARAALIDALKTHGLDLLPTASAVRATLARLALMRSLFDEDWPALNERTLVDRAEDWLGSALGAPPSLDRPKADDLRRAILALLDWRQQRDLDELAPLKTSSATGRDLEIDYLAPGGPMIEARAQEFFGMTAHPTIARGRVPLVISMLSPAHRQIALTKDLPGFWKGGYADMAKDMRAEYPKHDWPIDPAAARAHQGLTKARLRDRER